MSDAAARERASALIDQGAAALKAGDRARAQELLGQALRLDPRNERAWLWMSGVVTRDDQRRQCLERVLAINPQNEAARRGLANLAQPSGGQPPPAPDQPAPTPAQP
ncbi:MAG TPA: tetratricopeptide repeat protein, partial [Roseiflexaceae bacterium]|nr:tetratricopeptide repeat protein [Roseiflexaceae bacterium]